MEVNKRHLLGSALGVIYFLSVISAAPAALDKRSKEVIFFENANSEDDGVSKRSGRWTPPKSVADEIATEEQAYSQPSSPAGKGKMAAQYDSEEEEKLENEALDDLEEWAFDEALNFLVDKLIAEAYEEINAGYMYDGTTSLPVESIANDKTTVARVPPKPANKMNFDEQADALASLIAKQNQRPVQEQVEMEARAEATFDSSEGRETYDSSYDPSEKNPYDNGEESLYNNPQLQQSEGPAENKYKAEDMDQIKMTSADANAPENEEDQLTGGETEDEEDPFSVENLLEYFDYLRRLKDMEDTVKSQAGSYKESDADKPKIRKRRSVADDWFNSEKSSDEGICFTGAEVAELKELLFNLAKNRADSEQVINYLVENGINREPAGDYAVMEVEDEPNQLDDLAYRLNQRERPVYQPRYGGPQIKRGYDYSKNYNYGMKK